MAGRGFVVGKDWETEELTIIPQAADPSTSKSTPVPLAVILLLRPENVRFYRFIWPSLEV
jgi:hypothetical protein